MSGSFNPSALPVLPGVYTDFTAVPTTTVPPNPGGIVALPVVHDWGPLNELVFVPSFGNWELVFGLGDTAGRHAVYDCFRGEGVDGLGGASGLWLVRMGSEDAAPASANLDNPAKAHAIAIKARYSGTRGNKLKAVASAIVGHKQTITILDDTAELESFTFSTQGATAITDIVAEINAVSPWVEAVLVKEGETGLEAATTPLTEGANGETLTGEDWLNAANRFNDVDFAVFAPYDLPYTPGEEGKAIVETIEALKAWNAEQCVGGHRFEIAFGGALDEDPATAIVRALALSAPEVLTLGGPGANDETFGTRSTSQLIPRLAGIRAQRGETQAGHFARMAGTLPRPKGDGSAVTLGEIENAVENGVIILQRDRYAPAPTRIVKDVTTWAPKARSKQEEEQPRDIYGSPKIVQSMQQFANEAEQKLEHELIGKVRVSAQTRGVAAARVLQLAQTRIASGAFQPGLTVSAVPGSDNDEFIRLKVTLAFGRALAQLFLDASVS